MAHLAGPLECPSNSPVNISAMCAISLEDRPEVHELSDVFDLPTSPADAVPVLLCCHPTISHDIFFGCLMSSVPVPLVPSLILVALQDHYFAATRPLFLRLGIRPAFDIFVTASAPAYR